MSPAQSRAIAYSMEEVAVKAASSQHEYGWVVVLLMWGFKEVIFFLGKFSKGDGREKEVLSILENQTKLIGEQKEVLSKVSSVLDLYRESVIKLTSDMAVVKERLRADND